MIMYDWVILISASLAFFAGYATGWWEGRKREWVETEIEK